MGEAAGGCSGAWVPAPGVFAGGEGWNRPPEHPQPRAGAGAATAQICLFPFHPSPAHHPRLPVSNLNVFLT